MLRFIMALLGRSYEPCKGCAVLQHQLDMVNHEKEVLMNTMLDLVKPKIVQVPTREIEPIKSRIVNWNRERAILEENSRNESRIRAEAEKINKEVNVEELEKLEREVGIS